MTAADVCALLRSKRFSFSNEDDLQMGIAHALTTAGAPFAREVSLSGRDRIDFLLPCGIGIEVKIDGSLAALTRQLSRYAQHDRILCLVVVSSRLRLTALPDALSGKPIIPIALPVAFA